MASITLNHIVKTFDDGVTVIPDLNLEIKDKEFVIFVGPSGCGKSTTLRMIAGLEDISSGELIIGGKTVNNIPPKDRDIAMVFQSYALYPHMTVYKNMAFALKLRKEPKYVIDKKVRQAAKILELEPYLNRKPKALSGGQRQRVALGRAMVRNPCAFLLDEPLSQLDPKAVTTVSSMLKRINEELGVTVIVVSHSSEEFIDFCDRLVILENGEIICNDTPYNAKNNASLLPYFPVCTRLFDERPLNIKSAVSLADKLKEKPLENKNENKSEVCVNLKNITFAYNKNQRDILSCLDFKAYKAQINCIIGANGSGKTTLLKVIAGIKKQYFGKSKILGKCSYMPQNVKYLFTKDLVSEEIDAQTAEKLSIADCLNQHPFDLSGGQAQKLAFGILLEQDADILLLDEPTKAFDEFSKNDLKSLLFELKAQGKTIIMVSHDLDFVGDIADNVSFLSDGIISKAGGRREVLSSLNFYTTQIRRITKRYLAFAVSMGDIL